MSNLIFKDGQIYDEATGQTLAVIPHFDPEDEQQQKTGKLLAAAPEMLKALKEAKEQIEYLQSKGSPRTRPTTNECLRVIEEVISNQ